MEHGDMQPVRLMLQLFNLNGSNFNDFVTSKPGLLTSSAQGNLVQAVMLTRAVVTARHVSTSPYLHGLQQNLWGLLRIQVGQVIQEDGKANG